MGDVKQAPGTLAVAAWFVRLVARRPVAWLRRHWQRARLSAEGAQVDAGAEIREGRDGRIALAPSVVVGHGSLLIATTDGQAPGPVWLSIGRGSAVNEYCNLRAAGADIRIGEDCMLAQFVTIVSSNHGTALGSRMIGQPWDLSRGGVTIGNDVWIGANVVVLPGVVVGDGAVIAAGAVVHRSIPPNEIWGGVPAKRISLRKSAPE